MSEPLKVTSPFGSPDSLRAMQQSFKQFYDLHTKMDYGYEDVDGLQYVGTVRNFGSEMLLETRKLRMVRPPYTLIKPCVDFEYYFNIMPSDYINTYDQQNMLMACLKQYVCYKPHEYKIHIKDAEEVVILRSDGYSEENVRKHRFLKTYTNPLMIIDDDDQNPIELYVGGVKDGNVDHLVTWYISLDDPYLQYYEADENEPGSYVSIDLVGNEDIPFIWFCTNDMRMLPDVRWTENSDWRSRPILTNGTNGHDHNLMYPLVYGEQNIPYDDFGHVYAYDDGFWYFRIEGDYVYSHDGRLRDRDVDAKIFRVQLVRCDTESYDAVPNVIHTMTYDDQYVKVTLSENWKGKSIFRIPSDTSWDYDRKRYGNTAVACIPLREFANNISSDENRNPIYIPLLRMKFDDAFFNQYESQINQMRAGVYIDYTRNYSDNGIDKYRGIVYRLAEFDGLPGYYKSNMLEHHAHVDLYAIRDDANVRNQKPMDKQTAAIILDAGVPQNYSNAVTDDMKSSIVYDIGNASVMHRYITDWNIATGTENEISDTVFINGNHFADRYAPNSYEYPRFVYHGNRHFSLSLVNMNPDTEYGRGYLLSNDPAAYINNELDEKHKKAPRTVARICDIPTSFTQLQHIEGVSPTLIIDEKYTRQYASYSQVLRNTIWNENRSKWYISRWRPYPSKYTLVYFPVLPPMWTLEDILDENGYIEEQPATVKLTGMEDQCTIALSDGVNYMIGDKVGFHIGGIYFIGIVRAVDETRPTQMSLLIDDEIMDQPDDYAQYVDVPIMNFNGNPSVYTLETRTGIGSGAKLTLTINSDLWAAAHDFTRKIIPDGIYTYYRNMITGGISVIPYDKTNNTWDETQAVQISGDITIGNPVYDPSMTRNVRTVENTYLFNMFNTQHVNNSQAISISDSKFKVFTQIEVPFNEDAGYVISKLTSGTNLAKFVSDQGFNAWNSLIALVPSKSMDTSYLLAWYYDLNERTLFNNNTTELLHNGNTILPRRSETNFYSYDNAYNCIKLNIDKATGQLIPFMYDISHTTYDTYNWNRSYMTLSGSRSITLSSLIPIDLSLYSTDAMLLYTGNEANFNIYRFNHMNRIHEIETYEKTLNAYTNMSLHARIRNTFGNDATALTDYAYTETPYEVDTVYYEGGIIIDPLTNITYLATKNFVSTTLVDDLSSGNLKYIGPSCKHEKLVNYIVNRSYSSPFYNNTDLSLFKQQHDDISSDYTMLSTEPSDWKMNCGRYYVINSYGNFTRVQMIIAYKPLTGETAPMWIPETFYRLIGDTYYVLETKPINWSTEFTRYYQKTKVAPDFISGKYYSSQLDENPFGAYVPIVDVCHSNVTAGNASNTALPLFVLRITCDTPLPNSFMEEYRVYDNDTDISENVLLIINDDKYVLHNEKWERH